MSLAMDRCILNASCCIGNSIGFYTLHRAHRELDLTSLAYAFT